MKEKPEDRMTWKPGEVGYIPPQGQGDELPPRKKPPTASAQSPDNSR